MNLQDRAFAVGIFIILGICCIGAYVAVSGFMNTNSGGLNLGLNVSTPSPTSGTPSDVSAGTAEAATPTLLPTGTSGPPTNTPKGFKPSATPSATVTPSSRGTPSPAFLADIPTITPASGTSGTPGASSTQPAATAPVPVGNCGYTYCPSPKGPPDDRAPTGNSCPTNYLWGFVIGSNGKGVPGVQVRYTNPDGESDHTFTKAPPDPAGRWDVAAPGGMWAIQILDSGGKPASPVIQIQAHVSDPSGKTCPTRLDFIQP
ncbi:MAG: hypothetical protein WCF84_26540 [Anaerolineae bacterium]